MNQFDNARFLYNTSISVLDQQLINYIEYQYTLLKNDFSYLIKPDKAWSNKLEKNIFVSFKLKYFHDTSYYKYNDFILLLSLKYDIARLSNILQNDNYYIRKYFFNNKYLSINIDTFLLLLTATQGLQQFPIFSSFYFNNTTFFIDYINVRVILPIYSVLIPFFLNRYKNSVDYKQKKFILSIFKVFINDYNNRQQTISFINQEYIEKMLPFMSLISNYFQDLFMNKPSSFNLANLLYLNIKNLNKNCIESIIACIQKKQYSYKLLEKIKDNCTLTEQQLELINSNILLKNL